MKRIPGNDEVASLSRGDWEDLCSSLCSLLYSAHRVEDRFGKGNGLDGWREIQGGIEGWQFRRLDGRLGVGQINHIKDNIALASNRSLGELSQPLIRFVLIVNVDPEPGHKGVIGEIERMDDLKKWALEKHQVAFSYYGVGWVRAQLLKNPQLYPSLFEDLGAAIQDAKDTVINGMTDIKDMLRRLTEPVEFETKYKTAIRILLKEAETHFSRGDKFQAREEYSKAITSLNDALRLLVDQNLDLDLEGKILSLLAGVEAMVGSQADAIQHGTRAVELLNKVNSKDYLLFAKGNLAFGLYLNKSYEQAESLFSEILSDYENDGNLPEIVRTLGHITELNNLNQSRKKALYFVERLRKSAIALSSVCGPSELSLSSMGTAANVMSALSIVDGEVIDLKMMYEAVEAYEYIEKICTGVGLVYLRLAAKARRGFCVWHLDKLNEAEKLFAEVAAEASDDFVRINADCLFNRGMVLREMHDLPKSNRVFLDARGLYEKMGDVSTVKDIDKMLEDGIRR